MSPTDFSWSLEGSLVAEAVITLAPVPLAFAAKRLGWIKVDDLLLQKIALSLSILFLAFFIYIFSSQSPVDTQEEDIKNFETSWQYIEDNYTSRDQDPRTRLAAALNKIVSSHATIHDRQQSSDLHQAVLYIAAWGDRSANSWSSVLAQHPGNPLERIAKYELDQLTHTGRGPDLIDPIWQTLQTDLENAGNSPNFRSDEAIANLAIQIKNKFPPPYSSDQDHLLKQANAAVARVNESDGRLAALHRLAESWRNRRPCQSVDLDLMKTPLQAYDRGRPATSDYKSDEDVFVEAGILRDWLRKDFTRETPTYIISADHTNLGSLIESQLHDVLSHSIKLVRWQDAAICIQIDDPVRSEQDGSNASEGASADTSFNMLLSWIDGATLAPVRPVSSGPIHQPGTFMITDETRRKSLIAAVNAAQADILSLMRSATTR